MSDEIMLLTREGWIEEDLNKFDLLRELIDEIECFLSPSVPNNSEAVSATRVRRVNVALSRAPKKPWRTNGGVQT